MRDFCFSLFGVVFSCFFDLNEPTRRKEEDFKRMENFPSINIYTRHKIRRYGGSKGIVYFYFPRCDSADCGEVYVFPSVYIPKSFQMSTI